jgi:YVTN family beta-propeller protein
VTVIATATNTVVGSPITVGNDPYGVAVTPDGSKVYVANLADGTVTVISTATNTVIGSPITVGSGPIANGIGTSSHVAGELFKMMTGADMVHVPYRGAAPALTDMIGGQVQVMFDNTASTIEHLRAGRLRALAVTTATRSEVLPNIPTVGDFLPGYEASTWVGLGVPRNTSGEIIDELNAEINAALGDSKMRARFTDLGGTVLALSPAEFGKFVAAETEKWGKVVKFAGIKAD